MDMKHKMGRVAFSKAFDIAYGRIEKDRQKGMLEIFNLVEGYVTKTGNYDLSNFRACLEDKDSALYKYISRIIDETDRHELKTFVLNFLYEAMSRGTSLIHQARAKYQCNVPWLILMDPTSACNLKCTGCWAAEYGYKLNLTLEEMDNLISQGKELGI